jgi:hypothetical protein
MTAMASWVKGLAVPSPPPGPCDANAAPADNEASVRVAVKAKRDIRCRVRDDVMTISRDEEAWGSYGRQAVPVLGIYRVFRQSLYRFASQSGEFLMTRWIGTAVLAAVLMSGGSTVLSPAVAASLPAVQQTLGAPQVTDLGARRRTRHSARYAYRPYYPPVYYDRPQAYRPYPYAVPAPFFLGFGFGPWW